MNATGGELSVLSDNNYFIPCSGVRIGFDPTSYVVSESDGTVSFVIVKNGQNQAPVSVQFSTADGTATGIIATSLATQLTTSLNIFIDSTNRIRENQAY